MRFTQIEEVMATETILENYIYEAIEIEKEGLKVVLKKTADFNIPDEFRMKLNENADLKSAFQALSPGRQKAYIFYFSEPKLSKTRASRIEKYVPHILNGTGIND